MASSSEKPRATDHKGDSASPYILTVGLEIHAELKTASKMFCGCANDPDGEPNAHVCPVCMGHPGTLPVVNREAVRHVLRIGEALGGTLADFTEFDRKHYFYPDIPKGYQISQYQYPLITGGSLAGVTLTRIHLEEDTAKSTHDAGEGSIVDFNRSSVPLMELVTEPVIHDAATAVKFARELQLLLQYLGAGEAQMEKGQMRVEANISIATAADTAARKFGTKVEVKNLNSFRAVERAILYEMDRHERALERGEKIIQETRGWDENKQATFSQRAKEDSHDYRYFPDPDISKFKIGEVAAFSHEALRASLPELPWAKRERYAADFGIKASDIELIVNTLPLATYYESVIAHFTHKKIDIKKCAQLAANYLLSDLASHTKSEPLESALARITTDQFSELIFLAAEGQVTSRAAKDILAHLFKSKNPALKVADLAAEMGLAKGSHSHDIDAIAKDVVAANPKVVADYKGGKAAALQALIGQCMKATKGASDPAHIREALLKALEGSK